MNLRDTAESVALPVLALAGGMLLFGLFVWVGGHDPVLEGMNYLVEGVAGKI